MNSTCGESSRRGFIGAVSASLGAAVLAPATIEAAAASRSRRSATTAPAAKPVKASPQEISGAATSPGWDALVPTGWNRYARRFVDAPTLSWEPLAGAAAYIVQFAHADDPSARSARLDKPVFDMTGGWSSLENGPIDLIAWAVDGGDHPLTSARVRRFWKSPGFDGAAQEPVDYLQSVERNLAYLLAPARDAVRAYERGLPRSCWSSTEENITGARRMLAFPALHHPSFIMAYLAYAAHAPDGARAAEAERQAKQYADWLLDNRHPADWTCSLFPFSTIQDGRPEGYIEGRNVTLFRAARVGEAMVAMFHRVKDQKYLDYAHHLASVYLKLQRPDGAWPYRIDPKDGRVVEEYTSNAVTPARLLGMLEEIEPNSQYRAAREKAARWVLDNPVRDYRWQGMYEDVREAPPYRNLQHFDTNEMIRYLVHYHRGEAAHVRTAEMLNRWIEDQFVIWRERDACIEVCCPAPTVLEQYTCYEPMEGHTARWIETLMALHRATGDQTYLAKAINAGNAIVRAQQPSGAYSTWGSDVRFSRPFESRDWPGCNANAVSGLLRLDQYLKALPASREQAQPL